MPTELTVMSFNIHHGEGTDDVLSLSRIAEVIKIADVIGLQEVDRHYGERSDNADQAAELAALLGYHVVFGANIDDDPPADGEPRMQYGTAILSRHPILSWSNDRLTGSAEDEPRGLLRATIDVDGTEFGFANVHLAVESDAARRAQAEQIIGLIDHDRPSVLVGDFNAEPDAPELTSLIAALSDTWSGDGDPSTYPSDQPMERIDLILSTPAVRTVAARIVDSDPTASDHRPVLARIIIG
ncbi:metal-dependent hydrolase [Microlunatus elymi]|uniref:Metal-dependent hydrolase n=1 Tax=Microlunatus elymi TaxID=2596828 RepID=A0A516Q1S0_9ACTN|nr:endonuclease/exonuclease/phosphatase family protein [Microlunatus elymi]QDP97376.1 metal-dependent hydrolase [Microlunatus elymi]